MQKENHDKMHNVKPLTELNPGQEVLFLSPADPSQYIEGTISSHASTQRIYITESQGRTYHHTHQYICPLHTGTIPITRPCSFQDPELESNNQTAADPPISTIPGPSSEAANCQFHPLQDFHQQN